MRVKSLVVRPLRPSAGTRAHVLAGTLRCGVNEDLALWILERRTLEAKTLSDQIRRAMATDHCAIRRFFGRKIACRGYVAELGFADRPGSKWRNDCAPEFSLWSDFPRESIVKPSHRCGNVTVITSEASRRKATGNRRLLWSNRAIHPDNLDQKALASVLVKHVTRSYWSRFVSWPKPAYRRVL